MELSNYLGVLRRHWKGVTACALLGVLLAGVLSLLTPARYTSRTSVLFAVQAASSAGDLAQGSTYAEKQVQSYAEVATAPVVLQPVIDRLALDTTPGELDQSIDASVPQKTVIVEISVIRRDPLEAAAIANAVGAELSNAVVGLTPKTPQGQDAVKATIISPALPATSPTTPRVAQNLALGLLIGLALGHAIALLREQLDTWVRDEDDLKQITDDSVLGAVPMDENAKEHPLAVVSDPLGHRAEAYRRLRTNLQFVNLDERQRPLVVTSSMPGEGKSTTTVNLALALAEAGKKVLLVDADLRRPMVASYLGIESAVGLTTVLIGQAALEDVVQPFGNAGLHVLPCGQIPPNPSELLGSRQMRTLLDLASERYDAVLLDTSPLLPVTDSAVLGRLVGGALLVVGSGKVKRDQVAESLNALEVAGVQVDGLVLNMVRRARSDRYRYDYNYKPYAPRENTGSSPQASAPEPAGVPRVIAPQERPQAG